MTSLCHSNYTIFVIQYLGWEVVHGDGSNENKVSDIEGGSANNG
jgi:hypothetical protein